MAPLYAIIKNDITEKPHETQSRKKEISFLTQISEISEKKYI